MNLSQSEALAILNRLKGSSVYLRTRFTTPDDPSLGALRVSSEATLEECDESQLRFTWPPSGHLYLSLEGASFRIPDHDDAALIGLEIELPDGIKCVVCPSRDLIVDQMLDSTSGKPSAPEQN